MKRTPAENLKSDLLYLALLEGNCDAQQQREVADWIKRLVNMLTEDQDRALHEGYDTLREKMDSDPEIRGTQVGAISNAIRDRLVKLTDSLSPLAPRSDISAIKLEIEALLDFYPMGDR